MDKLMAALESIPPGPDDTDPEPDSDLDPSAKPEGKSEPGATPDYESADR